MSDITSEEFHRRVEKCQEAFSDIKESLARIEATQKAISGTLDAQTVAIAEFGREQAKIREDLGGVKVRASFLGALAGALGGLLAGFAAWVKSNL